jgi:hypothetical protein
MAAHSVAIYHDLFTAGSDCDHSEGVWGACVPGQTHYLLVLFMRPRPPPLLLLALVLLLGMQQAHDAAAAAAGICCKLLCLQDQQYTSGSILGVASQPSAKNQPLGRTVKCMYQET